jgi:beta-lactamase class A
VQPRALVRIACLVGVAIGATVAGSQTLLPPVRPGGHVTALGDASTVAGTLDSPVAHSGASLWAKNDLAVYGAADTASATRTHEASGFAFTATGQAAWSAGALWYQVMWHASDAQGSRTGWVRAEDVSFAVANLAPPTSGASAQGGGFASSGVGVLLGVSLNAYVATLGGTAGFAAYDVTHDTWYGYNQQMSFIMASSSKVVIMLTLLSETEAQGREPNGNETYLLATMIENSNNDSAQALFDEIGGASAMAAFMAHAKVGGVQPNADAWGWSTTTPQAMVQLLALLYRGKVLTAQDRSLVLGLMGQVETDQRNGVGDTAPAGAAVALKDGWVTGPDGQWVANSSGIVTLGQETYIVAVYTHHDSSLDQGWAITRQIARMVARLLA